MSLIALLLFVKGIFEKVDFEEISIRQKAWKITQTVSLYLYKYQFMLLGLYRDNLARRAYMCVWYFIKVIVTLLM